jgi:hypothetical protein
MTRTPPWFAFRLEEVILKSIDEGKRGSARTGAARR